MKNTWKETYQEIKSGIPSPYKWSIALIFAIFAILSILASCGTTSFPQFEADIIKDVSKDVVGVDLESGLAVPK